MTDAREPGDEEAPADLAAILRSEKLLSDLAERRDTTDPQAGGDPERLLAALAADVDDNTRTDAGAPLPMPGRRRALRGRWAAAVIGLAAALGTTGVAAAGANVFAPIGGLFGGGARPTAVSGTESTRTDERTATPSRRGPVRHADPARTTGVPAPTSYAPAGDGGAPMRTSDKIRSAEEPPRRTASARPTAAPSGGDTPTASATPTPTRSNPWPPAPPPSKDRLRIGGGLDGLLGTPTTSPAGDD